MEKDIRSDSEHVKLEEEKPKISEQEETQEEEEGRVKDDPNSTCQNSSNSGSGSTTTVPAGAQLTIFYGGSVKVFNGIPEEKVNEILRMAAAAAVKSGDKKTIEAENASSTQFQATLPAGQNTVAAMGSLLAQLCPAQKSTLCKMQAEFPIARRHSLQRFLEKRLDRLVSKNPYPPSPAMKVENDMEI